jgi:hypothetical protein
MMRTPDESGEITHGIQMRGRRRSIACFLGAGYSVVAGVPLAKDLLRTDYVLTLSERSKKRFATLREHYEEWQHHL